MRTVATPPTLTPDSSRLSPSSQHSLSLLHDFGSLPTSLLVTDTTATAYPVAITTLNQNTAPR